MITQNMTPPLVRTKANQGLNNNHPNHPDYQDMIHDQVAYDQAFCKPPSPPSLKTSQGSAPVAKGATSPITIRNIIERGISSRIEDILYASDFAAYLAFSSNLPTERAKRFIYNLKTNIYQLNKSLKDASARSILQGLIIAANLDLDIGKGHYYLTRYQGGEDVSFQISWRGLRYIAMKTKKIKDMIVGQVHKNDLFELEFNQIPKHVPARERGEIEFFYAAVQLIDNTWRYYSMSIADIEAQCSQSKKFVPYKSFLNYLNTGNKPSNPNNSPRTWLYFWPGMAKAKVIIKLFNYQLGGLSDAIDTLAIIDDQKDIDEVDSGEQLSYPDGSYPGGPEKEILHDLMYK